MKRIGFWSENPPDLQGGVEDGRIQSYLDAPSIELWLQCIFLPNARFAAETANLPKRSQVGEIARREYDFHTRMPEADDLLILLYEFDRIVNDAAEPQGPRAT